MKTFKFFRKFIEYDRENTIWRTGAGKHLPVVWMTNSHITNTLDCLRGVGFARIPDPYMGKTHTEWIEILEQELITRENEN